MKLQGLTRGAPADPRPVRDGARRRWASGSSGSSSPTSPTRPTTPARARPARRAPSRSTPGPPTRSRWRSALGVPDLRRRRTSSTGPRRSRTPDEDGDEREDEVEGPPHDAHAGGRPIRRPRDRGASTHPRLAIVPRLRELARAVEGRPARRRVRRARRRRGAGVRSPRIGSPRRRPARGVRPHPQPQRSRSRGTARQMTAASRPSASRRSAGSAARRPRRRDRPRALELDEQLGREEGAAGLDADAARAPRGGTACRRSRRRGPVRPKKIAVGEPVGARVERRGSRGSARLIR